MLVQARRLVVQHLHHRQKIVLQQQLGFGFADARALAGGEGVAIADDPAAVLAPHGARPEALEGLYQDHPFAGDLQAWRGRFGHRF